MVLSLVRDVIGYDLLLRLADAESSISFLPFEPYSTLVQPSRAVALQLLDRLGQGHYGRYMYQQMHVVGGTTSGKQSYVLCLRDAGKISAKLGRVRDEIRTLLGAEDAMHEYPGVRARHSGRVFER
jgi:hypothetical protein